MTSPAARYNRRATRPAPRRAPRLVTAAISCIGALAALNASTPRLLLSAPFTALVRRDSVIAAMPVARLSADAFGASGGVNVRFALPGDTLSYPLDLQGDELALAYQWVGIGARALDAGEPRPLTGPAVVAPIQPGFYQLALLSGGERRVVNGPTLAVKVPFARKLGAMLNGYRIGTYLAERLGGHRDRPDGFVEIAADQVDLPLTKHFTIGDFLTHDSQQTWPRYVAVNPKLLDKLELVLSEIARVNGGDPAIDVAVEVNSGFRTPLHNRRVRYAAGDSRHQYGDAADVKIDANFDGRFTAIDARLVALAAEIVEINHPELVGGVGLYTSRRYTTPYVHIDTRGTRVRWRS